MNKKSMAPPSGTVPGETPPQPASPARSAGARDGTASLAHGGRSGQERSAQTGRPSAPCPDLSEKQRRYLRGLAHPLGPVIRLGKEGLTDAVAKETTRALFDHELIKVKGPGGDRDARDALFAALAERTGSALVHRIGNVAVLYRPRPDVKRILIPD